MTELLNKFRKDNITRLAELGERLDTRKVDDFRELKIRTNINSQAEGSAEVFLGKTRVVVGVKLQLGVPYPDSPNEGTISVTAEMSPIASPDFEMGPPREPAIELARVVDRGIRESRTIDLEKLCVKEKAKVWTVFIDMWVLDYDGNLIDACGIAALAALKTAKLPLLKEEKDEFVKTGELIELPIRDLPIPCTVAKLGKFLLVDPNADEDMAMDARITITTNSKGNICSIQKGEGGFFTEDEILSAAEISVGRGKQVRSLL